MAKLLIFEKEMNNLKTNRTPVYNNAVLTPSKMAVRAAFLLIVHVFTLHLLPFPRHTDKAVEKVFMSRQNLPYHL